MIVHIKNNWSIAEPEHNLYINKLIDNSLEKSKQLTKLDFTHQFIKITKTLLTSNNLDDINESIKLFNIAKTILTKKSFQTFKADLKKIFNYNTFIAKSTKPWNAYKLCEHSKNRTCPYCNQAYSFTVMEENSNNSKTKSLRPTLDHFYPKDKYPHLSLSLANLIPSCSICNSTLKGKTDFSETPHLHPLYDEESITFSCDTEKHTIVDIRSNFETLRPNLKILIKPKRECKNQKTP